MLRYFEFEVKNYDFTQRCLAYESLRPAQDSDHNLRQLAGNGYRCHAQ